MASTVVRGFEKDGCCDVSGKKGPCFVITIDGGNEQRVHQTRVIELLRFLFNADQKGSVVEPDRRQS